MLLGMLRQNTVEQAGAGAGGRRAGGSRLHFYARETQLFLLTRIVRLDLSGVHCNTRENTRRSDYINCQQDPSRKEMVRFRRGVDGSTSVDKGAKMSAGKPVF